MIVIRVFEIDGSLFYIVNGRDELLEQVRAFLDGYYTNISNGNEKLSLRLRKEQDDDCLLIEVSK